MKILGLSIYDADQYIIDSNQSPVRHIPYPASRNFIMTILVLMWSGTCAAYLGGILPFGISIAAHTVFSLMFFFTVAVFYEAEKNRSSRLIKLRQINV